ncbi:MAG: LacI family transcriptional regulator [Actinomycetota bacterium]|nr:LacI family transcriptional regulator [Actinomycetota bacterium]
MDERRETPGVSGVPTMVTVAREAGVSVATVSNALNNPDRVASDTLTRVREVIDRLGFIRNNAARSLVTRRSDGLGLVVPDLENSLFVDMARGAQTSGRELGLNLLVANSGFSLDSMREDPEHPDQQDQYLDYFAEARVRGLLLSPMRDPRSGMGRIREHIVPIVVLNWDDPEPDWCTVVMDNEQVGRLAIEHLVSTGIRRVYFLCPQAPLQPLVDRRRGAFAAAAALGVTVIEVATDDLWSLDGRVAAGPIIDAWTAADGQIALLGVTDAVALGTLEALRSRPHIRVPTDIAVMGMDDNHHADHSDWITLTSFDFPGFQMGEQAIRMLADELAAPVGTHVHQRIVLPAEVHPRASTGPALA